MLRAVGALAGVWLLDGTPSVRALAGSVLAAGGVAPVLAGEGKGRPAAAEAPASPEN